MSNNLKVLQINKFHYLRGGSERYVFSLSKVLEENGHTVIPFSMHDNSNVVSDYSEYFIDNIDLHKFSIKNIIKFFYNYEAVLKLERLIKKERPDIAHLHNIAHQITPAIIKLLKKHKIPMVQTLHDYKLICPNAMLYNKAGNCEKCLGGKYYNCFLNSCLHNSRAKSLLGCLEAYLNNKILRAYDGVDLFLAPSDYIKNQCVKFGIDGNRIKVLVNFLDEEWIDNSRFQISDFKLSNVQEIDNNKEVYLLYFGRLSEEKGIASLIEAFQFVEDKSLKLIIAGTGPMELSLRELIKKLDLASRIDLVGFKKDRDLSDLIKNAKAVMMPSLWPENMPYSMLESMALGKIVIASRVGGLPEVIVDKENGFLHQAGKSEDIAEIVNALQKISSENLVLIAKNSQKTSLRFKGDRHFAEIKDTYNTLIGKNN